MGDLISDHCLILGELDLPSPATQKQVIICGKYGKICSSEFSKDIRDSNLTNSPGDVSAATDAYNSILHEILDKHAPEKPKTVIRRPIQKWFNDELRSTKRRRRKAERKCQDSDNSIDLHQDYKCVKYESESLIKSTKTEYYNAAITQCGSDSKSVQKVVDELLYRGPEVTLPTSNCDGDLCMGGILGVKDTAP